VVEVLPRFFVLSIKEAWIWCAHLAVSSSPLRTRQVSDGSPQRCGSSHKDGVVVFKCCFDYTIFEGKEHVVNI
jgi:hypothetical protein